MVVLVNLDPTIGSEIKKTRPCLIISPNAANKHLNTLIVAPLTSTLRGIPTRLQVNFGGQAGELCFDQMRAIDEERVLKSLGWLDDKARPLANKLLQEMFSEP
jgi:mRNA interferase MazF